MKFSLNWLREFVELPDDVGELTELLTLAGVEIEGIETRGANFAHVVVAQITASAQHPNADRLSVCQVDDGSGQASRSFAEQRITKSATRCRLPSRARFCLTNSKSRRANCAESNRRACFAARKNSALPRMLPDCSSFRRTRKSARRSASFSLTTPFSMSKSHRTAPISSVISGWRGKSPRSLQGKRPACRSGTTTVEPSSAAGGAPAVQISALRECPFYSARRIENVTVGSEPGLVAGPARGSRAARDQQHCRHHQFCDAGNRPAAARL